MSRILLVASGRCSHEILTLSLLVMLSMCLSALRLAIHHPTVLIGTKCRTP
jgi:hypothetical protein